MRPLLALLLTAGLGATAPQLRVLSADLVTGPGREPRPGDAPFQARLEVEVAIEGLRVGSVPEFRLWRRAAGPRLTRLRAESVAPEGEGRYRILASPETRGGTLVVDLRLRGRRVARATAPIRLRALPAPRPRTGDDPRA